MSEPVEFAPLPGTGATGAQPSEPLHRLQDVPVELTVEIGRTHMTIAETLKLGPGSIVSLNRLAGEPVDLLVNGKLIARGEVVVIDEEFGLRITDIVSAADRPSEIEAVGATPLAAPTVDPGLMSEDDIAAYLGGAPGDNPLADAGPPPPVSDDDIAAYLGGSAAAPANDLAAPVGADGLSVPLDDDDVAAYLGGLSGGGSPDAVAADGDALATDDAFDAADDPFADVADDQLVSPHGDGDGDGVVDAGSGLDDDDVPAYLGEPADDAVEDGSGWVIEGDDDDLLAGGSEPADDPR